MEREHLATLMSRSIQNVGTETTKVIMKPKWGMLGTASVE